MRFIFVHGSWHGAWCWKPLADFIEHHGHHVQCIDLPGHGENKAPLKDVTLDHYTSYFETILKSSKIPPVVVAHSMAGTIAAPVLEKFPELISHLYLIASYIPKKGQSLVEMAEGFNNTEVHTVLREDKKNNTHQLSPEGAKRLFYPDCSTEIQEWALSKIQPQPLGPIKTRRDWDETGIHASKRTYVICEKDQVVNPLSQKEILNHYLCKTASIDTGHFPFLSKPKELAEILLGD